MLAQRAMDIVVTGSKRMAVQEELGDFKLYRIPDPVTVASKAQKQVAFLAKDAVPLSTVYVSQVFGNNIDGAVLTLRTRNRKALGLGVPLPAGRVAVFEQAGGRPILVGETSTDDRAVGEDVELKLRASVGVKPVLTKLAVKSRSASYRLEVTNANPVPVAYEAIFDPRWGQKMSPEGTSLISRDGKLVWAVTIPANGSVTLVYTRQPD